MDSKSKLYKLSLLILGLLFIVSCNNTDDISDYSKDKEIYLYGEIHGQEDLIEEEFDLWSAYYHKHGMRNLFLEIANFEAGLLNLWMKADNDDILEIFAKDYGTIHGAKHYEAMLKKIKNDCPETVFYGTDISNFSESLGNTYLAYLEEENNINAEEIKRVKEVMASGLYRNSYLDKYLGYDNADFHIRKMADFREDRLTENFIYEYNRLDDKRIMGIYGAYHISNPTNHDMIDGHIMGDRLSSTYGDILFREIIAKDEHFNKRWE